MQIRYTPSFANSLPHIIDYWQHTLKIDSENTQAFVDHINDKIMLLRDSPEMGNEVTTLYGFNQTTYRITIGHSYAIFYRIQGNVIIIGSIYGNKQMKVRF